MKIVTLTIAMLALMPSTALAHKHHRHHRHPVASAISGGTAPLPHVYYIRSTGGVVIAP